MKNNEREQKCVKSKEREQKCVKSKIIASFYSFVCIHFTFPFFLFLRAITLTCALYFLAFF